MPSNVSVAFLRGLPKCEHHMHLEGSLRPEILFLLAKRNGIQLPQDDPAFASTEALLKRYDAFTSLDDFLHYYYIGMSVLVTQQDFEDLAYDYFDRASKDGVVHAEVFFDPQAHTSRGISYETILAGFSKARSRALVVLGLTSELICCLLRHLPPVECHDLFSEQSVQASFSNGLVVGLGLDSSEKDFPPKLFQKSFESAKAQGLRLTAHAGEEGPPEFIESAICDLGVSRIDHGIRLADDPSLLKSVADRGIMLTVCPLSNKRLRCVSDIKQLPIRTFLDAGIRFSVNSDDPAYFGGYILDNYVAIQEAFSLTANDWQVICRNGIEGSWCSDQRKQELLALLDVYCKDNSLVE